MNSDAEVVYLPKGGDEPMPRRDVVDIRGNIQHETEKAYRFRPEDSDETVWLPKSMVEWYPEDETMVIPEWLATEKGLI